MTLWEHPTCSVTVFPHSSRPPTHHKYLLCALNHASPLFITVLFLSALAKQPLSGSQPSVVIHQTTPKTLPTDL